MIDPSGPTKRTPRRVHRELTADEQERLRAARETVEADSRHCSAAGL